jgi:hypothetical protein
LILALSKTVNRPASAGTSGGGCLGDPIVMMDTGFWIKNSSIYGSSGYTGYRIDRRRQIVGPQGYTRHWIYRDQIYSAMEGNTGFVVKEARIFGPSNDMPWELTFKQQVQRGRDMRGRARVHGST